MNLDKPVSPRTMARLSLCGLGVAAWLLGSKVGMDAFDAMAFAFILTISVGGILDFIRAKE